MLEAVQAEIDDLMGLVAKKYSTSPNSAHCRTRALAARMCQGLGRPFPLVPTALPDTSPSLLSLNLPLVFCVPSPTHTPHTTLYVSSLGTCLSSLLLIIPTSQLALSSRWSSHRANLCSSPYFDRAIWTDTHAFIGAKAFPSRCPSTFWRSPNA